MRRHVTPWVVIVAVAAAMVFFGGIWFVVGNRKADREFSRPGSVRIGRRVPPGRSNSLCRRLNMAGNSYAIRGMFDSALTCYREVLRISQEDGLNDRMAAAYTNISNVFGDLQKPESARFYMNAAMALDRLSRKPGKVMNSLLEQGTYRFSVLGDYDSAIVLLEKALAESQEQAATPWARWGALQSGHDPGNPQALRLRQGPTGKLRSEDPRAQGCGEPRRAR